MITHKIIKYVPPPIQQWRQPAFSALLKPTKEEVEAHLLRHPLKVGDYVYYGGVHGPIAAPAISIVAEIETDPEKLKPSHSHPKCYLLMQLTGTSEFCRKPDYAFSRDPWTRWDDGIGMSLVSDEHKEKLIDDYVQNYIKEYLPNARRYIRQG